MPKHPLTEKLKTEASAYADRRREAADATNAANRQKTALRNAVKEHWKREQLPIGSYVRSNGLEFRYEATETEIIEPERVLELYENEEITRDQFLRMISIGKSEAKNVLGGDQVQSFTTTKIGKTADIRIEALPIEHVDDEYIMENSKVKTRKPVRRVKVKDKSDQRQAVSTRSKRRIKVRSKK